MQKVKLCIDFSAHSYTDKDLHVSAAHVVDCMEGNEHFAGLAAQVQVVKERNNEFVTLLARNEMGNRLLTALKKEARGALEGELRSLTWKVQDICRGDEAMTLSSGLRVHKKPSVAGILDQPTNVRIKPGPVSGSLEVSWHGVTNASSYEIRVTRAPRTPGSQYSIQTTTRRKVLIENLEPREAYLVQVAGIGANPLRVWSVEVVSGWVW